MNDLALARVVHVLGVVLWIGGVAMVTTVLLPAVRRMKSVEERLQFFEQIERRFATQARVTTLLTGLSGFYMLYALDAWWRFREPAYWWVHAMVAVWAIFTMMLFVIEPFVLHRVLAAKVRRAPEKTFALVQRMHWVLLTLSLGAVFGAVAGSHGWLFFRG